MTTLTLHKQARPDARPRWTLDEVLGFARFFFMSGEDRLDVLLGNRQI